MTHQQMLFSSPGRVPHSHLTDRGFRRKKLGFVLSTIMVVPEVSSVPRMEGIRRSSNNRSPVTHRSPRRAGSTAGSSSMVSAKMTSFSLNDLPALAEFCPPDAEVWGSWGNMSDLVRKGGVDMQLFIPPTQVLPSIDRFCDS